MMKKSAGILAYKFENDKLYVFLEHMGGPYWRCKDKGAWSIPKGEFEDEVAIQAAIREFHEETGFLLSEESLSFLASIKQSSNKLVTIFMIETDLDASKIVSNIFPLEWPKGSGNVQEFPEMDRAEWKEIEEAKEYILKGQVKFLEKLQEKLDGGNRL